MTKPQFKDQMTYTAYKVCHHTQTLSMIPVSWQKLLQFTWLKRQVNADLAYGMGIFSWLLLINDAACINKWHETNRCIFFIIFVLKQLLSTANSFEKQGWNDQKQGSETSPQSTGHNNFK